VTRRVSTTHRIAIVSLPALGPLGLKSKLRRTLTEIVREFVGSEQRAGTGGPRARIRRRWQRGLLREMTTDTAGPLGGWRILFLPAVLIGNFRLLLGMVRSNRPWRLTIRLYNALVAALATGAFGLVYFDIWRISAAMSWWRLAVTSIVSIAVTSAAIIFVHGLWERSADPRIRDRVALFNLATTGTVVLGILSLYVILFVLLLAGSALVITPDLLSSELQLGAGASTYLDHAWFVASLATVGGALGASLESDEAVRVAAYASNLGTGMRQEP